MCKEFKLVLETYFQDYMSQLFNSASIKINECIFRARNINLNSTKKFSENSLNKILYSKSNIDFIGFNGFNTKESGAPSKDICFVDGRCNHYFESVLYAAEFEHTAIEEIAKIKNQFISVVKIKIIKDLDVALFSIELIRVSNSENKKEVWF